MSIQQDESFWGPPPNFVKHIHAAIRSWDIFAEDAYTSVAGAFKALDDKAARESVSLSLAAKESFFFTVLEKEGYLPTTYFEPTTNLQLTNHVVSAVSCLGAIAFCRGEIQAGRAVSAAWALVEVNQIYDSFIKAGFIDPLLKADRVARAGTKKGRESGHQKEHLEIENRLSDVKKWRREDDLTDTQCVKRGTQVWRSLRKKKGKEVKVSVSVARGMVRAARERRRQQASRSATDT